MKYQTFGEKHPFHCMHSKSIYSLTLGYPKRILITLRISSHSSLQSTQNPHEIQLKIHKIKKNKGVLHEAPCMHDKRILKDQINPLLKGGSQCLSLGGSIKKKSLEKKIVAAGIFHKPYLWQARDEE